MFRAETRSNSSQIANLGSLIMKNQFPVFMLHYPRWSSDKWSVFKGIDRLRSDKLMRTRSNVPVIFPDNGNSPGEEFAVDCIHRHTFSKNSRKSSKITKRQ